MHAGDAGGVIAANLKVIEAVGAALEGTGKPFVTPAGTLVLWSGGIAGRPGTEHDIVEGGPLADSENAAVASAPACPGPLARARAAARHRRRTRRRPRR